LEDIQLERYKKMNLEQFQENTKKDNAED